MSDMHEFDRSVIHDATLSAAFKAVCPADVDFSMSVDIDDIVEVILAWSPVCPMPCDADTNFDQRVDIDDIVEVILWWGTCYQ
jgi:hypothetical protein